MLLGGTIYKNCETGSELGSETGNNTKRHSLKTHANASSNTKRTGCFVHQRTLAFDRSPIAAVYGLGHLLESATSRQDALARASSTGIRSGQRQIPNRRASVASRSTERKEAAVRTVWGRDPVSLQNSALASWFEAAWQTQPSPRSLARPANCSRL